MVIEFFDGGTVKRPKGGGPTVFSSYIDTAVEEPIPIDQWRQKIVDRYTNGDPAPLDPNLYLTYEPISGMSGHTIAHGAVVPADQYAFINEQSLLTALTGLGTVRAYRGQVTIVDGTKTIDTLAYLLPEQDSTMGIYLPFEISLVDGITFTIALYRRLAFVEMAHQQPPETGTHYTLYGCAINGNSVEKYYENQPPSTDDITTYNNFYGTISSTGSGAVLPSQSSQLHCMISSHLQVNFDIDRSVTAPFHFTWVSPDGNLTLHLTSDPAPI